MLTEDEAKTKWCPFTHKRVIVMIDSGSDQQAIENAERVSAQSNCLARGCMAWRKVDERITYTGQDVMVREPGGGGRIEKERRVIDVGVCGAAPG
jgi:hypothetical protein